MNQKFDWWFDAKFGMFVHWGLYAIPAGSWGGLVNANSSEWIMQHLRIPVKDYEKLALEFNPINFDAENMVRLAKEAGMKYLVITAKHHDGFCMFKTEYSHYNIVDATPFGRDIIAEVGAACARQGVKLGLYYSHILDWHHPHACGNDWDYNPEAKDFEIYYREKCRPQIEELLTHYGDISIMWFDMPGATERYYSEDIVTIVHQLQPDCLINSRVGFGMGDYVTMGDNTIPLVTKSGYWETPYTLNDNWGYNALDQNWKNPEKCLDLLINITGKGGNLLLNIGPDSMGNIPEGSSAILREVGNWMTVNGGSIYGTQKIPTYPIDTREVRFTFKPGTLFIHMFYWPKVPVVYIHHMTNMVNSAYAVAEPEKPLSFENGIAETGAHYIKINLPDKEQTEYPNVIALEIEGRPEYDEIDF